MLESTLVVAMIAQRFRLRFAPEQPVMPHFGGTLRPARNLRMRLEER